MKWEEVLELARRADAHYSMSEQQQRMIWELAEGVPEGGTIVELGVCNGKTAVVLALAAAQQKATYTGIDNWGLEGAHQQVWELLNGLGIKDEHWHLLADNTHDRKFKAAFPAGVDFLVIDAGHDPDNVFADCELWIPKVKPGGIVVWDDVPSGTDWKCSCHWAVRESVELWACDWEQAACWGKTWARRKPL